MLKIDEPIIVKVPATSANCGPGFDCLGVACSLYNTFTYEVVASGLELVIEGEGKDALSANPSNLAFVSFFKIWNKITEKEIGLKVHMRNNIPLSRGLGSSSTAIVAGLFAANAMTGNTLTKDELVSLATEIEGHPDNVAPAILGGFTISYMADNLAHAFSFIPVKKFKLVAVVPAMPLATSKARAAIPRQVPHCDAVFNASRTALLIGALMSGEYGYLPAALEDKLHQPYRAGLIPGMQEAFAIAKAKGAYNAIISGAGSTLMAYAPMTSNTEEIGRAMVEVLASKGLDAIYHVLNIDVEGARIL
ncbi:MAG: homoserine kinase [Acidaminococcaceae bacterium]|nr:homoserine kinase [Acidaminococcaceae bacterium]MDD4721747.1 homoserine kinase [Acidaminococcaceae bacterium]